MKKNDNTEQSSVKARLLKFLEYINISQGEFEKKSDLSNGYVNNIRKSIKPETFDKKIKPKFPELNKFWLLHGEGDMLNDNYKTTYLTKSNDSAQINDLFKPIPFYNVDVSAGNVVFLDNGLIKGQEPDDYMYIPVQVDADIAFPTYGHSMYPEISNGDRVAYKFIKDWSFFNFGMKYMIVTEEQRMVKYLKKHKNAGFVLLESRNPDYEPIDMPIESIRNILQVRYIGKIEM